MPGGTGPGAPEKGLERAGLDLPAVTLAVAKKPGTNAVDMVTDLDRVLARLPEGAVSFWHVAVDDPSDLARRIT